MKKYLLGAVIIFFVFFVSPKTFAVDLTNNYKGYVVLNHKYEDVEKNINKKLEDSSFRAAPLKNVAHAYYETSQNNDNYYIRFYPANHDTNIYIVSEKKFDFNNNQLTKVLDSLSYKYEKLQDKEALKEYKFDFIALARSGAFDGFFVIPDYLKPIKKGVSKVNNLFSGKKKQKPLKQYSEDSKEIKLTLLETKQYSDSANNLSIKSKEYRFKNKENKYVHAFEYTVKNESNSPIILETVKCDSIKTMRDVNITAAADLDKLNLLSSLGSFPPVLVLSAGSSLALKVPNYVRIVKITKETSRYGKALPENYTIQPNSEMRILLMKNKDNPSPLNFSFNKNNKTIEAAL